MIWGSETTQDAFLGGRLTLLQPKTGYRAGVDPVLLAASVPAQAGQSVLDLGCGVGAAMLCLHTRVAGLAVHGVELQSDYAAAARENCTRAGAVAQVTCADLRALPDDLKQQRFDHVITNPPYFEAHRGKGPQDPGRHTAFAGETDLHTWITCAAKRVAPRGYLTLIHKVGRLPDIIRALPLSMGSIVVLPLAARTGQAADRMILQARQDGKAPFQMLPPLVLHNGAQHLSDAPDYTAPVRDILRHGAALSLNN